MKRIEIPCDLTVNALQKLPEMKGKIVWCGHVDHEWTYSFNRFPEYPSYCISNSVEDVCELIIKAVKELHNKGEVVEDDVDDWIVDYSKIRLIFDGKKLSFNCFWYWFISDQYIDDVRCKLKDKIPNLVDFSRQYSDN